MMVLFREFYCFLKEAMKIDRCDKCNWEIQNVRTLAEDMRKLQEQGVR
jgi:hypothetical protein